MQTVKLGPYIRTPEGHESGVEHSSRMIEEISDLCIDAVLRQIPIRASEFLIAQRTHRVIISRTTRLFSAFIHIKTNKLHCVNLRTIQTVQGKKMENRPIMSKTFLLLNIQYILELM